MRCDRIWTKARIITCAPGAAALGLIDDGTLAARDGRIVWVGPRAEAPAFAADETVDCEGMLLTPGLVECHTHLLFAGDRSGEFEQRLAGVSYAEIARGGGGILASMRATRAADDAALLAGTRSRLAAFAAEGVTTLEMKSGYGLDETTELRLLALGRRLGTEGTMRVATTYLGAHAQPPDLARADYLDLICETMIPRIAHENLADAVDAFCEAIAFDAAETGRVFQAARDHGLPVKLHADQLSDSGGATLAARWHALSADHLEYADSEGLAAMARAGTVAVLLPGAYYVLRETTKPPVAAMRVAGCAIALGSDCNPGTAPIASLLLAAHMGCVFFGLTIEEAWRGITLNAAAALGLAGEVGSLEQGKSCDLAIWNAETPAAIIAWIGPGKLHRRILKGRDA